MTRHVLKPLCINLWILILDCPKLWIITAKATVLLKTNYPKKPTFHTFKGSMKIIIDISSSRLINLQGLFLSTLYSPFISLSLMIWLIQRICLQRIKKWVYMNTQFCLRLIFLLSFCQTMSQRQIQNGANSLNRTTNYEFRYLT